MKSAFVVLALLVATASAQCDVQSLISTNEGYATCVYTDTTGNPTIGIGFNLNKAGAAQLIAGQGYDYNSIVAGTTCLSDAAVVALFQNDVANAQACAQKTAPFFGNLSPNAQSVVVDLIFNLGCGGYSSFTGFNSFLANGDYAGAANDLQTQTRWCGQVGTRCSRDCSCLTS